MSLYAELAKSQYSAAPGDRLSKIHVGFEGSFGSHGVNPRTLTSEHLSKLVQVRHNNCNPRLRIVHYGPIWLRLVR